MVIAWIQSSTLNCSSVAPVRGATLGAANPREPALRAATGEIGLHGRLHDAAQQAVAWLEAFFVDLEVALEVPLDQLVEPRALGMPRAVNAARLGGAHASGSAEGEPGRR